MKKTQAQVKRARKRAKGKTENQVPYVAISSCMSDDGQQFYLGTVVRAPLEAFSAECMGPVIKKFDDECAAKVHVVRGARLVRDDTKMEEYFQTIDIATGEMVMMIRLPFKPAA